MRRHDPDEDPSQRVVGTIGIVFGLLFLVVGIVRLTRPDPDVLLLVLNMLFGVLWIGVDVVLWRRALRAGNDD